MCGEMVTMYAGRTVAEIEAAARTFFDEIVAPNLFTEFLELTQRLKEQGCELWSVSSTNGWVIREGAGRFGVPAGNVLAGEADCPNDIVSERLTRMPSGEGKAVALREFVVPKHRDIGAVFGNSIHDAAMLRLAQHAFAVNPNTDLERIAQEKGWTVYWPQRMAIRT
jgi:phosphoserine phosphatase